MAIKAVEALKGSLGGRKFQAHLASLDRSTESGKGRRSGVSHRGLGPLLLKDRILTPMESTRNFLWWTMLRKV